MLKILTQVFVASTIAATGTVNAQEFFNGFETDTHGWDTFGGPFDAIRVADGTLGIPSATGDWHATGDVPATNWGGYSSTFPTGGYITSVDIFLDPAADYLNDTRLDFTSAINQPDGNHRRDFAFNLGFYDDNDVTGPGAGTNRFVISASTNTGRGNTYPKNPARLPIAIHATDWYTFQHDFRNNGAGVLEVELSIFDSSGNLVNSWLLSDSSDVIGSTIGGNRYGWFANNELGPELAFDNSLKATDSDGDGIGDDQDACPDSDYSEFVDAGSGPTTIPNAEIGVDEFGCTIQDYVNECAANARNHGQYVRCVVHLANALYQEGVITKHQRKQMKTGAAQSDIGK